MIHHLTNGLWALDLEQQQMKPLRPVALCFSLSSKPVPAALPVKILSSAWKAKVFKSPLVALEVFTKTQPNSL